MPGGTRHTPLGTSGKVSDDPGDAGTREESPLFKHLRTYAALKEKLDVGAKWLSGQLREKGRTPETEKEMERFERTVMRPLDEAFRKLPAEEQIKELS